MSADILNSIKENLFKGDSDKVAELVNQAIEQKIGVRDILNNGLIDAMSIIGGKFKANEIFIPEVLIAAGAMHKGMAVLEPYLAKSDVKPRAKVIIGTVKSDLHDIGKNLVAMMFKGAGFEIEDLGIDVDPEKFVEKAKEKQPNLIAMSALLSTALDYMKITVSKLKEAGISAKTIVGGAPVTEDYAGIIGANGYAPDAASAVDKAKEILEL